MSLRDYYSSATYIINYPALANRKSISATLRVKYQIAQSQAYLDNWLEYQTANDVRSFKPLHEKPVSQWPKRPTVDGDAYLAAKRRWRRSTY